MGQFWEEEENTSGRPEQRAKEIGCDYGAVGRLLEYVSIMLQKFGMMFLEQLNSPHLPIRCQPCNGRAFREGFCLSFENGPSASP